MPATSQPILTAAEEQAESDARLLALRQDYDDILCGDDEDEDQQPEIVLGVMPTWPKGSRGARILAGHIHFAEIEVHDDLCRQADIAMRRVTSFQDPAIRRSHLPALAEAEAAYELWMNDADWIDAYGAPWFRTDFDTVTGTYPNTVKAS